MSLFKEALVVSIYLALSTFSIELNKDVVEGEYEVLEDINDRETILVGERCSLCWETKFKEEE